MNSTVDNDLVLNFTSLRMIDMLQTGLLIRHHIYNSSQFLVSRSLNILYYKMYATVDNELDNVCY